MGAPRRPDVIEPLKAAIYRRGQKGMSFTTTTLADELSIRKVSDRALISQALYHWQQSGWLQQLPKLGKANLYQVKEGKLENLKPAPVPAPAKPAAAPLGAPLLQSAPVSQPATLDAVMHAWLDAQLKPYGTMLQAVVGEVKRLRADLDNVLEVLSRPEGDRPAMPEPQPQEAFTQELAHASAAMAPPAPRPVEDSALAVIVSRLGIDWHVEPSACDSFDELDGHSQTRVLRVLKTAAQLNGAWVKTGKVFATVPRSHAAPGTFWNFRAGKQHRVVIRRNGDTKWLVAIVKRNDQRWYGHIKEAGR